MSKLLRQVCLFSIISLFVLPGCKTKNNETLQTVFGSQLSGEEKITNTSLQYTFTIPARITSPRDFYNYIYFQGDTFCFNLSGDQLKHITSVEMVHEPSNMVIPIESKHVNKSFMAGFSLIGTILETLIMKDIVIVNDTKRGKLAIPLCLRVITAQDKGQKKCTTVRLQWDPASK